MNIPSTSCRNVMIRLNVRDKGENKQTRKFASIPCSMTHHVPAVHSVIFTLTKILLIMSCFDTVPGGADAYKIPPRFSRPASFYFQMNPEGYPQFGYNPWADKRKLEWLMNEINSIRANLSSEWTKRKDEQIVSVSLDNSDKTRSPCNQLDPAELRECNGEEKRDEKSAKKQQITEVTKRIVIENYKRRILRQMNLSEPPQISRPEVNDSTWTSLPKILQYRLKAEIDSANQVIEDPVKEDEEKETFILVQPFPFHLKRMASSTFTIKIAEEIDPRHISYAVVHTEQAGDLPVGSELSLWEIIPPWPGVAQSPHGETYFDDGPVYSEMNSTPSSSDEDPQENLPELDSEQSAVPPSFDAASSHLFKLIRPQIASAVVRENQDATSIEFDVTARLIHWLKYRSKRNSKSSLIRHVLIVCANCADRANPIDSQKTVLEIGYRHGLRRRRRSVNSVDDGLTDVCQKSGHRFNCCTQPMSIPFSEIGWHTWIVHPKTFELNFCQGSCQAAGAKSMHYNLLNVLHQKNITQLAGIPRDTIQSCCHPTRKTSFSMLYFDQQKVLRMHTIHNLVVLGCGCS